MIFLLSAAETLRAYGEIASTSSTVPPVIPSAFGATYSKYYTVVRIATLWGSLLGNLIFGYIGDRFGRKKMYGTELIVIVISTFGMSFSASSPRAVNIVAVVMIWRFLFAIGIGGDVPTSTVIAAESAPTDSRGLYVVTLYTAQATGAIVGGCLT
ncbi:MFS general substrate transporter, partial [Caulochytrium protostelioides]